MKKIKTYYNNTMNVDGREDWGFKRNKKEIENEIIYNGVTYKLVERLDNYNKALVYKFNDSYILLSYNTVVVEIISKLLVLNGSFSSTTLKHIKEFCNKYANKQVTKKDCDEKLILAI